MGQGSIVAKGIDMAYAEFVELVRNKVQPGDVWVSTQYGIQTIIGLNSRRDLCYQQGDGPSPSKISLSLSDVYTILNRFSGEKISSNDLKTERPGTFDSMKKGHSCNCYAFFRLLKEIGIIRVIVGKGVRGSPYSSRLP